jgi:hypothetical protein
VLCLLSEGELVYIPRQAREFHSTCVSHLVPLWMPQILETPQFDENAACEVTKES